MKHPNSYPIVELKQCNKNKATIIPLTESPKIVVVGTGRLTGK